MTLAAVKKLAIKLPLKQRIQLANALFNTIPSMRGPSSLEELERRADEVESGKIKGISWEEFEQEITTIEKSLKGAPANGATRRGRKSPR